MNGNNTILNSFIVLEGLDGAGTTTQSRLLSKKFSAENIPCSITAEPTDLPSGRLIRDILSGRLQADPRTVALLFAADRNEHLYGPGGGIADTVSRGEWVISDRYFFSSLAYQSVECGFSWVLELNNNFPLPQYLIYLDVPVGECRSRISGRDQEELYDPEDFQMKVSRGYEQVLTLYSGTAMEILRIDGLKPPETITDEIWSFLNIPPI
ncbi:MAG: dTMP kinase [Spirochaetia bacterium]